MTLEFNHEIAIFQSALKCVIQKYTCIKSLEYNHRRSALEIIRRAYEDILKIREDDNLSVLQKHHLDRKLALGLMCSIYKEKVEYWQPGECFEQFRDIYPPTSWPFILEIIKSFQWNDYLIECLDSTHPESLIAILNDILMHILNPDDENIPILFRILTILIQKMFSFHCNAFTNKRILNIEDQINTVSSFLAQQIAISSQWQPVTLNKYYVHLFDCIFDTCDALLNTDTEKETTTTSEIITMKNLAQYDMEKTCVKQLLTDTSFDNLQWLIKFYQLCYDSLLMLDLNEMKQFALISGGKLSEKNGLLLDLKVYLNALNAKSIVCDANRFREVVSLLQLIHQRMEMLFESIAEIEPKVTPDVIGIIDGRKRHYEKYLDQFIGNFSLLKNIEYLECLKRNASLINEIRARNLISWLMNEKEKPDIFVEYIQQTVLRAFSMWPLLVRQHFQQVCLIEYEEKGVLMTDHFEEELTTTFNKFVCADIEAINNLLVQMGRLCLQATRKTIAQTVFQAMNSRSKEHCETLGLILKTVLCSNSKMISVESKITCDVLNELLLNYHMTELQFQYLKVFIHKLLKCKQNEYPLIKYADFMRVCILPYLDQWNPGHGSRVTLFAMQLLQIILNTDCFLKSSQWTQEFKPSVLLCYLALIIAQCKVIRRNSVATVDYMQIKMQAVTTLNKLISLIGQNLAFVQKYEIMWLCNKLDSVDEFLVFYFLNLTDYFHVDLTTRKCEDPFQILLEFSCCNDDNLKASLENFQTLVKNTGKDAENQLISALTKVLPYFIYDEWKRVSIIIEHIFQNLTVNFLANWKPCVTLTSQTSHNICCMSSIFLNSIYIYLNQNSGFNVHFMMQCYRSIIKEKLDSFEHPEVTSVAAELFFQVYHLMRFFSSEAVEEGFVILMELSQIYMKDSNLQHIKKMKKVVKDMKMTTYQSSLLKVLTQTT